MIKDTTNLNTADVITADNKIWQRLFHVIAVNISAAAAAVTVIAAMTATRLMSVVL